jgi:6-phosphofructokinase 1
MTSASPSGSKSASSGDSSSSWPGRTRSFSSTRNERAGIVTCGGLCPGLNNVIRSLFLELHYSYGVAEVLGFRGGYSGLDPAHGAEPVKITPQFVDGLHHGI